jgi:polysaccharide deacetylase family protein (PEP-CTERM system associated)
MNAPVDRFPEALAHTRRQLPAGAIRNAMSVDVEDYFQVSAFAPYIDRASWPSMPCRVEANVDTILQLFDDNGIKATFFTLGWIAERYPALVGRIHAAGHEVASHGYGHQRVSEQTPDEFLDDIVRSRDLLEQITGERVLGYRAPSFSINGATPWAWDMLERAGYRYSSSVYPVKHDHYGMLDAPRFPFLAGAGKTVLELPITTARVLDRNLPAGGGGYFRLLPYPLSRWMIGRVNADDLRPAIFYFHPWEIDPGQPRPGKLDLKTRFRHYVNLGRTQERLAALTQDFRWDRIDRIFLEHE